MRIIAPFFAAAAVFAGDAPPPTIPAPTILIAPFENLSGIRQMIDYEIAAPSSVPATKDSTPAGKDTSDTKAAAEPKKTLRIDRLCEAPRSLLEDAIVQLGGKVVEHPRTDSLLQDADFLRASSLANPSDAVRWGKLAGAKLVLLGNINRIRVETKQFQGYGVVTQKTINSAEVRVRIVEVESGRVIFSKTVTGTADKTDTQYAQATDSDVAYGVVKDAVESIAKDPDFIRVVRGDSK